jgi:hypothetical protein
MGALTSPADRVERLRRHARDLVTPIGVAHLPGGPIVVRRPATEEWDWVVLALEDDPLYRSRSLAIPAAARARITAVADAGIEFDHLLIAHEVPKIDTLPPGSTEKKGWELELIEKTGLARPERSARRLDAALGAAGRVARRTTEVVAAGALATAGALAVVLDADPVLMGAIIVRTSPAGVDAALFEIARWRL